MRADIRLVPPKPSRSPFFYARGTYLGCYVDRSLKTADEAVAKKELRRIKRQIENRPFPGEARTTFKEAVETYQSAIPDLSNNDRRFHRDLVKAIGKTPIDQIDTPFVDKLAARLLPTAAPATRNRQIYTPISAILRRAGLNTHFYRPKGANGRRRRDWLRENQVDALLTAAWKYHPRFAALLTMLFYTGLRLSEALRLKISDLDFESSYAEIAETKNGEPQGAHLPPIVVRALRQALNEPANATYKRLLEPRSSGSVFCLTKSRSLYLHFREVQARSGVAIPPGISFHIARHTYGAWMRRLGIRLEETGRWSSRDGTKAYDHYDLPAMARKADAFPGAL